jgi:long-chain acyl-CoA synthetase
MRLGAIWVGLNRQLATPEQCYVLRDAGVSLLVAGADVAAGLRSERGGLPELRHLVEADPGAGSPWAQLVAGSEAAPPATEIDPFAPAAIAYTSGTTGFPKGAVHSQHNLLLPGAVRAAGGADPPEEPLGVVLPLTILNLMVLGPLVAFQVGCPCVCMDRIDPVGIADWVSREGIAAFAGVPAILHDLLTHPDVTAEQLAPLKRPQVGGAECPEAFRELYRERFGREVSIGYGMTEAPTAVTHGEGGSRQPGLCGRALPQVSITIRDESGRELPAGSVGEICVGTARSGAWAGVYTPMLGYWGQPEATREALRDGVYHSGDVGVLDSEGTLYIRGRRTELILRGGANVYPAEVERVLHGDPRIAACAVLGRSDARLGERVAAVVQLVPGAHASAAELRERCRSQLAAYKIPEHWVFVETMPRNAMNKIVKPRLLSLVEGREGAA